MVVFGDVYGFNVELMQRLKDERLVEPVIAQL
jgi:hypothetical protein